MEIMKLQLLEASMEKNGIISTIKCDILASQKKTHVAYPL